MRFKANEYANLYRGMVHDTIRKHKAAVPSVSKLLARHLLFRKLAVIQHCFSTSPEYGKETNKVLSPITNKIC